LGILNFWRWVAIVSINNIDVISNKNNDIEYSSDLTSNESFAGVEV